MQSPDYYIEQNTKKTDYQKAGHHQRFETNLHDYNSPILITNSACGGKEMPMIDSEY